MLFHVSGRMKDYRNQLIHLNNDVIICNYIICCFIDVSQVEILYLHVSYFSFPLLLYHMAGCFNKNIILLA